MKRNLFGVAFFSAIAACAVGQVTLDNFETGVTDWVVNGNAGESVAAYATSGANGTTAAAQHLDGGFSYAGRRTYTGVVPSDGNYKITFYYQNGPAGSPMRNCKVQINGVDQFVISGGDPVTAVTTWTAAETGVIALTTADTIEFRVVAGNAALTDYNMLVDEIILVPVLAVPITNKVRPLSTAFVAGTVNLSVVPSGGSGTYTSVGFDIGNDSTIDFTDSTSGDGFTYNWDTTAGADGATPVRVITTDDGAVTGETTVTYTVANAEGRETLFTSDFEAWTSGLPDGWTRVDYDNLNPATSIAVPTAVITEETADAYAGAKALHINYPSQPDPYRYTLLSPPFAADREDYQVSFAYRGGSFTRLAYFGSDDGISWRTMSRLYDPGAGSVWGEGIDAAWDPGATRPAFFAIATHFFGVGDLYIDSVSVTASAPPPVPLSAKHWELYY